MEFSLAEYIDHLQQEGRYSVTRREIKQSVDGMSESGLKKSLFRLTKIRRIKAVREGFYIIIPLEYRSRGTLPPEWFIHDLMHFVGKPYYVGLLSAAALHGASHHQPQEFQVIVPKAERAIRRDALTIAFYKKADMASSPTNELKTPTGSMRVSNPAVTALDLVAHANRVGGFDRVLTILMELKEKITPAMLVEAAERENAVSHIQRLGWLLERSGDDERVWKLAHWLMNKRPRETPLDPSLSREGHARDPRWKVIVNTEVEADL